MALADGGQPAGDGRDPGRAAVIRRVGQLGHVPGHHSGGGREGVDAQLAAEGGEVLPIGPVGAEGGRGSAADGGGRHLGLQGGQPFGDHGGPGRVGHQAGQHLDTLTGRGDLTHRFVDVALPQPAGRRRRRLRAWLEPLFLTHDKERLS